MIGIKMELPKGCMVCPIKDSCKSIKEHQDEYNKFLEYYTGYDNRFAWCNLVDLGKEDMSWEELVEKCKNLKGIYEITVFPTYITFGILFTQFYFQKNGYMVVDQNSIKKIDYSQMYQIIKSLVGDER